MSTSVSNHAPHGSRTRSWRTRASYLASIPGVLGMLDAAFADERWADERWDDERRADEKWADVRWHGSLAVTSDYIQQGLSQTLGEPALQGGLSAGIDENWSVGVWASTIDRYERTDAYLQGGDLEIDLFVARAWKISPEWIASLTATHYFYPDDPLPVRYDYDELTASLGYRSTWYATVAWSPNYSEASYWGVAEDKSALSYELSAIQPIRGGWSGNVGVGYRDLGELFDEQYWYGHAGLMLAARRLTLHLTYTYVDASARRLFGEERASNTWSGTLIWRFGAIE